MTFLKHFNILGENLDAIGVVVDDILDVHGCFERIYEIEKEMGIGEDSFGVGLAERMLQAGFAEGVVGGYDGKGLACGAWRLFEFEN